LFYFCQKFWKYLIFFSFNNFGKCFKFKLFWKMLYMIHGMQTIQLIVWPMLIARSHTIYSQQVYMNGTLSNICIRWVIINVKCTVVLSCHILVKLPKNFRMFILVCQKCVCMCVCLSMDTFVVSFPNGFGWNLAQSKMMMPTTK
jgi:hypothetical protein